VPFTLADKTLVVVAMMASFVLNEKSKPP